MKPRAVWPAAIICSVAVLVLCTAGTLAVRTQILMQVGAEAAHTRSTLGTLQSRISALEAQTAALTQVAPPDPAPLNALKSALDSSTKQIADFSARIEALEKKPVPVMAAAPAPASTSYAALASAVHSGAPFADALAAWKHDHTAAPDVLAPLEKTATNGVPTDAALRSQLQTALASSTTPATGETNSVIAQVNAHLAGLVSIKKQSAADGFDALRADAPTAEIPTLKREVMQLPPAARAPFAAWLDAVQAREDALAALANFATMPANATGAP